MVYDTRPNAGDEEEWRFMNPLKKAKKGGTRIRNLHEHAAEAQKHFAQAPTYARKPVQVRNMHEPKGSRLVDPFDYFRTLLTEEDEEMFCTRESMFAQVMLLKYDYLTKTIWREQEHYERVPRVLPIKIGEHVYYRRIDNAADCMTLYRFPVEELKSWNTDKGSVPAYPLDPALDETLSGMTDIEREQYGKN